MILVVELTISFGMIQISSEWKSKQVAVLAKQSIVRVLEPKSAGKVLVALRSIIKQTSTNKSMVQLLIREVKIE